MGSFNLGRIKGEKGDRGETGPKGDTGAKGDKGDKGDNGRDGLTPVFAVGEVITLQNGEEAEVEIDTSVPANPILSFKIPTGKDGRDALGDMAKSIYDPQGVSTDIFTYAQKLYDKCLKSEGGTLLGSLVAAETPLEERTVRNISIATEIPESGAEGDVFILLPNTPSKTLGECNEGDILVVEESGKETPYIVIGINYHGKGTVTLVRKYLSPVSCCYDYSKRGDYKMSDIDVFLETMYTSYFENKIRNSLVSAKLDVNTFRKCFLLKRTDYSGMDYFADVKNRAAYKDGTLTYAVHVTATAVTQKNIHAISQTGEFSSVSTQSAELFRPAIVLPSEFAVINTEYDSAPAVKAPESLPGIYIRTGGAWKECVLL